MIRLLIVDDHAIVREGLKKVLALTGDIAVTAEAADGAEAIQHLRGPAHFDLLMMDLVMPGVSGMDLIERIKAIVRPCPSLSSACTTSRR